MHWSKTTESLNTAENLQVTSPKHENETTEPPLTNRELLHSTRTIEKPSNQLIKIEDESPVRKLSLGGGKRESLSKPGSPKKRSSILSVFSFRRSSSNAGAEAETAEKEPSQNPPPGEGLTFLAKVSRFFIKKTTADAPNSSPKPKDGQTSQEGSPGHQGTLKRKESMKEGLKKRDTLSEVKPMVIYEEVTENEKDEFEQEVFQDRKLDFENKLKRYQYYENLKAVLNTPEDEENPNLMNINSSEEEDEQNRLFKNEGLDEYEKEYQKLANAIEETGGTLYAEKKNDFELIKMYSDRFPFLGLRKKIMFLLSLISFICYKIIKNKIFETLSLLLIIWNTIFIMIEDAVSFTDSFDLVFLILYTIEMMLKIFGLGFIFVPGAYLRDYWNILDFTIISTGYVPYLFAGNSSVNLKVLRSLRVLRPLRTISSIKNLKVLIMTLFQAFPLIMNSVMVVMFFLLVFAIAGLQLLAGLLKKRCFDPLTGLLDMSNDSNDPTFTGMMCGYDNCFGDNVCGKVMENPNYGLISFDTIFYSFLMVFQCITLEGWTQIMFYYVRTFSIYMVFFFIPLVWVGAYFLVNLTLAVINTTFNQSISKKIEEDPTEKNENDENNVTIADIRNAKLGERSHHKRTLRILGKTKMYGASEEDQQKDRNKLDLRWEDLLELKERIIEEQERADEEEKFKLMREAELDKKKKIKKKVKKTNLKYLPKPSKNLMLKDLQSKVLPLRFLIEKSEKTEKDESERLKGMRMFEICGVSQTALLKKKEIQLKEKLNLHKEAPHNNHKRSTVKKDQKHFSLLSTMAVENDEEEIFFKRIEEKMSHSPDIKLKNNQGTDIFSLKNKKKTRFLVKTKNEITNPSMILGKNEKLTSLKDISSNTPAKPNIRSFHRTKTHEEKPKEGRKPDQKKRVSEDHKKRSLTQITHGKSSLFEELLKKKLEREENKLKLSDLNLSSSNSFSSQESDLSSDILNDSDFNIGFIEKEKKEKVKKEASGKSKSKRNILTSSRLDLVSKKSSSQNPRKMSKKCSIMVSEAHSRLSKTSKKIISSLLMSAKNDDEAAENEVVSPENNAISSNNDAFDGSNSKTPTEKKGGVILRKNSRNPSNNIPQLEIKDSELLEKVQDTESTLKLNPCNPTLNQMAKKGFFHKVFSLTAFRKSKVYPQNPSFASTGSVSDASPRRRRGLGLNTENNKSLNKFQKELVSKRKKPNVLHYKLMINHEKNFKSASEEDVLQYRQEKERERLENDLQNRIHSVKYAIAYTSKKFKIKKMTSKEKKRQMQLLKEIANQKKKSIDFQSLDNRNVLKKLLNIKPETLQLPLCLRNDLFVIIKQQREALFGSRSRLTKTLTSMSPTTNVSMISQKSPLQLLKREHQQRKKKKKKVVEIDEKLSYEEWKVKIKEKLSERLTRQEIDQEFRNKDYFMCIREVDFTLKEKRDIVKLEDDNILQIKWSGEDICNESLKPGVEWSDFQRSKQVNHINKMLRALSSQFQDKNIWLVGFRGKFKIFQKHLVRFLEGKIFDNAMIASVLMNTVILAMDGLFYDTTTLNLFSKFNLSFTIIFAIEMGTKIVGYGPIGYLSDRMNIFDGVIVILSLVEVIVMSGGGALSAFRSVRIFRTFRVLRVTRLLRSLQFMGVIIDAIVSTLDSSIYVGLLLVLFLVIYSMIGNQLFQGKLNYTQTGIRQNFEDFQQSFLVSFQLLTVENWNEVLTVTLLSSTGAVLTSIYLISWIFLGNYVLLNLFLSILLSGFSKIKHYEDDDFDEEEQARIHEEKKKQIQEDKEKEKKIYHSHIQDVEEEFIKSSTLKKKEKPLFEGVSCEQSLCLFSKKSNIRQCAYRITHSDAFENFILGLIVFSSIKLALDTYFLQEDQNSLVIQASNIIDYLFNICFTTESILKIVSQGLVLDDGSYLRENWNQLDFFIVVSSLIDMSLPNFDLPFIKILRLLRILRPLRFVSHNLNMKIVVTALLNSVSAIFNVVIVMFLIFLMISILGMSLMQDRFGYCQGVTSVYGISKDTCVNVDKKTWGIYNTNFDNIFNALTTVFILSTQESWSNIMFLAEDSNTSEYGPILGNFSQISWFFVLALTICNIFLLNLFIGVIFYHFNQAQSSEDQNHALFLTAEQEKWLEIQKLIPNAQPDYQFFMIPTGRINVLANKIINYKYFDFFIMICIVFNIVTMALTFEGSTSFYDGMLEKINYFFTGIFISECILKICGLGGKGYLYSGWNRFDLFVVMSSIVDILMNNLGMSFFSFLRVGPQLARIMRVLRVSRLLKLVKSLKGLQKLLETLTLSLPSLMNVGALVLLVFFIYSVLGVFLFSDVNQGIVIDEYNNFNNFGMAMILLIRCSTGENWWIVMFDCSLVAPYCTQGVNCGNMFSPLFFITFIVICTFVMLNLFIFVILSEFGKHSQEEENPTQLFKDRLAEFRKVWSGLTAASKGIKLPSRLLIDFFKMMEPPLGFGKETRRELVAREIMKMNLLGDEDGNVYFNELLFATLKRSYGTDIFKNSSVECVQLIANEEFEISHRLEKIKNKTIRMEKKKRKLSNALNKLRSSLRISLTKSSVAPQESFKENDVKSTNNSNMEQGKKKVIINPMITILFLGMTFKAWKSFTSKKQEKLLLSNDSLPLVKNDSDEEDWEEDEESEENVDDFDENEQKEFESKAMKSRRVGFVNFGEIKEEEEGDDDDKNKSDSASSSESLEKEEGTDDDKEENVDQDGRKLSQTRRDENRLTALALERNSILRSSRNSVVTPINQRGSISGVSEPRFSNSPLLEKRTSKFGLALSPKNDDKNFSRKSVFKGKPGDIKKKENQSDSGQSSEESN